MDKLVNYLDTISDYNNSFESNLDSRFIIIEVDKNEINSEDELLDYIFNIKNTNQKHNAELIELNSFKYPLRNFIQSHMYSGLSSFINNNIRNKSDKINF